MGVNNVDQQRGHDGGEDRRDGGAREISEREREALEHRRVVARALSIPRHERAYPARVRCLSGRGAAHWGTDLTNGFAKANYRQRISHFTETLTFLSEEDKDWVMGRSIVERLKWS